MKWSGIDLSKPRIICVYGYTGSGKTYFTKWLIYQAWKHGMRVAVLDYHAEYLDMEQFADVYAIEPQFRNDLETIVEILEGWWHTTKWEYDMHVVDEANQYMLSTRTAPFAFRDMKNNHRHVGRSGLGTTVVYVMRRPTQFDTDIIEQAHYWIIFPVRGRNTIRYFNELRDGLGDAMFTLPQYHYLVVNERREWKQFPPLKYPPPWAEEAYRRRR